jgi:hypothetical protein
MVCVYVSMYVCTCVCMSGGMVCRVEVNTCLERERERIMFITHLKPLQPKTAITDDLNTCLFKDVAVFAD